MRSYQVLSYPVIWISYFGAFTLEKDIPPTWEEILLPLFYSGVAMVLAGFAVLLCGILRNKKGYVIALSLFVLFAALLYVIGAIYWQPEINKVLPVIVLSGLKFGADLLAETVPRQITE